MKSSQHKTTRITINGKPIETYLPTTKPSQIVYASGSCLLIPLFMQFDLIGTMDTIIKWSHVLTQALYGILYVLLVMIIFKGSLHLYYRWKNEKGEDSNGMD